jgi:site-specific DNA-methyltransferase (adenine-specific)
MRFNRIVFSSLSPHWATPKGVYDQLHAEFHFTLDPCPLQVATLDCLRSWEGERVFCNPPYGAEIRKYLVKAREADCTVYLLPARTDTQWFHAYCLQAEEIRFLKGRLKFGAATQNAPFPSMVVVYRNEQQRDK